MLGRDPIHRRRTASGALVTSILLAILGLVAPAAAAGAGPDGAAAPDGTTAADTPARYVAVQPHRVLDSRDGTGTPIGAWTAGQTREVAVTGGSTTIPTSATAVVFNLTGVVPTVGTHLTVWPAGDPMPDTSNLNVPAGKVRPNLVTARVGTGGRIAIRNNAGSMHVLADVVGYFTVSGPGSGHVGLVPHRLIDTRDGTGEFPSGWLGGQTRSFTVAGASTTVPYGASAVVLNVTGTWGTESTHLTLWPAGSGKPVASNLNLAAGETAANLVMVQVGTNGRVSLFSNSGFTHVIVDVVGYFSTVSGDGFVPLAPKRLLDSRNGTGTTTGPWTAESARTVVAAGGSTTVAAAATSVVLNLTGITTTDPTHLTAWPAGVPMPLASNLNLTPNDVRANLAVVAIGSDRRIGVFNNQGATHILGDAVGYFAPFPI